MFDRILSWLSVAAAVITVTFVTTVIAYNELKKEDYVLMVELADTKDPFQEISKIMNNSQATVSEITAIDESKNEYRIQVRSRKSKMKLLSAILDNTLVERAEFE